MKSADKADSVKGRYKSGARILVVEDDEILRIILNDRLGSEGFQVDEAADGREALGMIEQHNYNLVISDIKMPGLDGTRLLDEVKRILPETDVIMMTAYGSVEDAVDCLKKGASDYIIKPVDMDDILIRIKRLLNSQALMARCLSLEVSCQQSFQAIVGSGPKTRALLRLIGQVAKSDSTVLISGESGTGKELVATAIYQQSRRAHGPYIRVNCAAIPEGLIESELFGHEKGAFTGATGRKIGKFELADGGTILLDEIGELPIHLQTKLLRVLQERELERLGSVRTVKIDVRVLCATARNLVEEVKNRTFREDLFYRLQVIPIEVPPLRDRREDIPDLCRHFLEMFNREHGVNLTLSGEALNVLLDYNFPGNIRELRNIIERLTVLSPGPVIQAWDLPIDLVDRPENPETGVVKLAQAVAQAERNCLLGALRHTGGKRVEAARLLGISRKNLWQKLKLHQINI